MSSQPPPLTRFRFLGLRWRFLKEEIEKETFPSFPRINVDIVTSVSDKKEVLELKEENIQDMSEGAKRILEQIDASIRDGEEQTEVIASTVIMLKNANIFNRKDVSHSTDKPEELMTVASPRLATAVDSVEPRPPSFSKPSTTKTSVLTKRKIQEDYVKSISSGKLKNSPRKTRNKEGTIESMDISKSFKAYVLEKGVRIPACVEKAEVPESKSGAQTAESNPFSRQSLLTPGFFSRASSSGTPGLKSRGNLSFGISR
jgi:hypothetical protein